MNDCQNLLLFLLSESASQLAKSVEHLPTVGMLWVSCEQKVHALKGLVLVGRGDDLLKHEHFRCLCLSAMKKVKLDNSDRGVG